MLPAAERSDGTSSTVVVAGASGLVGRRLVRSLLERGFRVEALSQRPPNQRTAHGRESLTWTRLDLAREPPSRFPPLPAGSVIHAAPLWLLPRWLPTWAGRGVRRIVALGSTSRWTRTESTNPREREVASLLAEAEEAVGGLCDTHHMDWTVLRPTLIYDGEGDRSVAVIARVVRWLGAFPVAGRGAGLRQPVHATEVANACLDVLQTPRTFGRIYDTPGGETMTFAEMVLRIAEGVDREVRLLHLPVPLVRTALSAARWFPGLRHLTPEMADRMDQDLVFDASEARHDFGYSPGRFRFPSAPSC